jgi:hypothetical protein
MSNHANAPKVTASALSAAATRLFGTVVLDVADGLAGPAVYQPRLAAFLSIDGDDLGEDDGTLVVLVPPGHAAELIAEYGTAGKAAAAVNADLRREWALAR